jgi:Trk K+ transport system NAD-binding subunit
MSAGMGQEEAPVLVCGLGLFGQAVLARLRPFGVPLRLLDRCVPDWGSPGLEAALSQCLTLGDMRKPHVLRQAQVERARAVLLLSSDSGVNIEAALQVRLLNPDAEIVIRSSSDLDRLGSLLEQRLPGLAVVNPLQLSAGALVQALRPGPQLARFEANGEAFEVRDIPLEDHRFQRPVRLEEGGPSLVVMPRTFYSPRPDRRPSRSHGSVSAFASLLRRQWAHGRRLGLWFRSLSRLQMALLMAVPAMAVIGIPLFAARGGWVQGLFVMAALLKGDYVDPTNVVLGAGGGPQDDDAALVLGTLLYSLVGTLLSSALVAVILDQLLLTRLGVRRGRRLPRAAEPILLVGGGALASQVAAILRRERHVVVRVEAGGSQRREDGDAIEVASLQKAQALLQNVRVRAVALLSGQLLTDLQNTLQLQALWPEARFALLAHREAAGEGLGDLLGGASLISPTELGAEVAAATAFGERVEGVWRIRGQNLLQVRYRLNADDTLVGHTVSRLDHGYGLTVLLLWRHGQPRPLAMPAAGTVVAAGDQLVVLASLAALRRVEKGRIRPPAWEIAFQLPDLLGADQTLTLRQILARQLGVSPAEAAALMRDSRHLRLAVDPDCGALLQRDLQHQGISAQLEPVADAPAPG